MTRYEVLDVLVGAIGSAAVLATLLYLAWQTRAVREQAALLSAQIVSERLIGLDRAFLDYPELRPYFYDGRPADALDPAARDRVAALAEMMLDVFQLALTGGGAYSARHAAQIRTWIVRAFARSPVLRAHLHADRAVYSDALLDLMRAADVDRSAPV